MKHTLLVVSIAIMGFALHAQAIVIAPVNPSITVPTSQGSFKLQSNIRNNTDSVLHLRWVRTVNNIPAGWSTAICDLNLCWAPTVSTKSFTLNPSEEGDFSVTYYPTAEGTGIVNVLVYAVYDSANINFTNVFTGVVDNNVGVFSVADDEEKIKLYPNPATDYIMLSDISTATQLTIFNVVGKQVLQYEVDNKDTRYDIKNLPVGMYIVRLTDRQNRLVQTFRLSKKS